MSSIEEKVVAQIRNRAELGLNKYGVTMDRGDLSIHEWLQHAKEEAMDLAVYLTKLQEELSNEVEEEMLKRINSPDNVTDTYCESRERQNQEEEEREERMRIIGQNGNDGLHYEGTPFPKDYAEQMIAKSDKRSIYPGDMYITTNTF